MPNLDAIFFDIDDTLFSTSEFAERARAASVDAMIKVGLTLDHETLMQELREVVTEFTSNYDHHFDQLLRRIPKRYWKGVNPAIVIAAGVVAYHDTKVRELAPFPDAIALLRGLSARAPELVRGIITSGLMIKQAEKLIRLKVYDLLTPTAIFISDQIGINKPNAKLYRRACSDLNLKPARCIYVGDRPRSDVDPPNQLGMITVQVKRGRHQNETGETKPAYEVRDFYELRKILERDFGFDNLDPELPDRPRVGVQAAPTEEGDDALAPGI